MDHYDQHDHSIVTRLLGLAWRTAVCSVWLAGAPARPDMDALHMRGLPTDFDHAVEARSGTGCHPVTALGANRESAPIAADESLSGRPCASVVRCRGRERDSPADAHHPLSEQRLHPSTSCVRRDTSMTRSSNSLAAISWLPEPFQCRVVRGDSPDLAVRARDLRVQSANSCVSVRVRRPILASRPLGPAWL